MDFSFVLLFDLGVIMDLLVLDCDLVLVIVVMLICLFACSCRFCGFA